MQRDIIQSFIFKHRAIRGALVRLNDSYETVVMQHHYPSILGNLLGEGLLGVSLMGNFFKHPGKLTLQFQGQGDLTFLSTRITADHKIRGFIRANPDLITAKNLQAALEEGTLTMSYEGPGGAGQTHHSVIPVEDASIVKALENYFLRSEQLPTRFFFASTDEVASGMMLQVLPSAHPEGAYIDLEHVAVLAATLSDDELFTLPFENIIHRLYPEEDVEIFAPREIEFGCNCTVDKMQQAVINLGPAEMTRILEEQGFIEVMCEFCGRSYKYEDRDHGFGHDLFQSQPPL